MSADSRDNVYAVDSGNNRVQVFTSTGAFLGPCLGVLLMLTSLHLIDAGVSASITAVAPLFAMLIAARFHGERLTWRSLVGSVLAIGGIVVLFRR